LGAIGWMLALLLVLAVIAGLVAWQRPGWVSPYAGAIKQYVPSLVATPQPTFTTQQFSTGQIEFVVPNGQDVRSTLVAEYTRLARERFGPNTSVIGSTLSYLGPEPQKIADQADGAHYRGEMTGYVSAPQP
jgi:hypothetical protein